MTPLLREDGPPVLINRGFVPADRRDAAAPASPQAVATVTGLLRPTEPGGGFLPSGRTGQGHTAAAAERPQARA